MAIGIQSLAPQSAAFLQTLASALGMAPSLVGTASHFTPPAGTVTPRGLRRAGDSFCERPPALFLQFHGAVVADNKSFLALLAENRGSEQLSEIFRNADMPVPLQLEVMRTIESDKRLRHIAIHEFVFSTCHRALQDSTFNVDQKRTVYLQLKAVLANPRYLQDWLLNMYRGDGEALKEALYDIVKTLFREGMALEAHELKRIIDKEIA